MKKISDTNHQVLSTRYQQPGFNEGFDDARECDDNYDYVSAVNNCDALDDFEIISTNNQDVSIQILRY